MKTINMMSGAAAVKGQGVLSAYEEQVELVRDTLSDTFDIRINTASGGDIMHYHTLNLRYFLMLPLAKLRGKTVGYVHFLPETLNKSIKLPPMIKYIFNKYVLSFYKSMDYLVTVNPDFVERIALCGVKREKIRYIPNYVSDSHFHPETATCRDATRKQYGIAPNAFVVLSVGQIQQSKGFFNFIEMARRLPQMQFVWAGGFAFGVLSEGFNEIRRIVENPPANVRFTGLVEHMQMNAVYNMADVLFMPSFGELFPMTVLEAMSCHLPLLLRDLDNYKNILFDFYLKGDDNDAFEQILRRLAEDADLYGEAVERSTRGTQYYQREHIAHMWKDFYQDVLYGHALPEKSTKAIKRLVRQP